MHALVGPADLPQARHYRGSRRQSYAWASEDARGVGSCPPFTDAWPLAGQPRPAGVGCTAPGRSWQPSAERWTLWELEISQAPCLPGQLSYYFKYWEYTLDYNILWMQILMRLIDRIYVLYKYNCTLAVIQISRNCICLYAPCLRSDVGGWEPRSWAIWAEGLPLSSSDTTDILNFRS